LAGKLNQTATELGYNSYETISFILAFVQSLPYTSDLVTSGFDEYPRFPFETLVDGGGDCEDTAILFATITLILNYGTVYLNPPNHCAVGILGKNLPGYYLTYHDQLYYYCETTGDDFKIGDMPIEFQDTKMGIFEINTTYQYNPFYEFLLPTVTPLPTFTPIPTLEPTTETPPTPTIATTPKPTNTLTQYSGGNYSDFNNILIIIAVIAIITCAVIAIATKTRKPQYSAATMPTEQKLTEEKSNLDEVYCIYCGEKNRSEAVFCRRCGKKIV
jgi:ribosomal protein L40E